MVHSTIFDLHSRIFGLCVHAYMGGPCAHAHRPLAYAHDACGPYACTHSHAAPMCAQASSPLGLEAWPTGFGSCQHKALWALFPCANRPTSPVGLIGLLCAKQTMPSKAWLVFAVSSREDPSGAWIGSHSAMALWAMLALTLLGLWPRLLFFFGRDLWSLLSFSLHKQ